MEGAWWRWCFLPINAALVVIAGSRRLWGANPEVIGKVGEASCTGTWQLGEYGLFHILRH